MGAAVYFRLEVPFDRGPWFNAIRESRRLKIVDSRGDIQLRDIEAHGHHDNEGHGDPCPHCDDADHAVTRRDLENAVVKVSDNVPIYVKNVAKVIRMDSFSSI